MIETRVKIAAHAHAPPLVTMILVVVDTKSSAKPSILDYCFCSPAHTPFLIAYPCGIFPIIHIDFDYLLFIFQLYLTLWGLFVNHPT